ncbi:hypothetical protein [Salinithrix halophila]|uniref:Uncharacterized protein n=1 Tax=Salinithrix halophila TaxID=1485204 RepID=A0ABV8JCS5_9BACL
MTMRITRLIPLSVTGAMLFSCVFHPNFSEASTSDNGASSTASVIEQVTGVDGLIDQGASDSKNIFIADNESGTTKVPKNPESDPIINGNDMDSLKIHFPKIGLKNGVLTDNGTVVYEDKNHPVDFSVQVTNESVRSLIKIDNASAPHEYSFTLDLPKGTKLVSAKDYLGEEYDTGEVFVVDSDNIIQGVFDPAWAKGANGKPVPTNYIIDGNKLTQVINFNKNTAIPVVADPSWTKIAKCSGAIAWFLGSNAVPAAKIIKAKKYIKALGGLRKSAMLLIKASTWEERLREGKVEQLCKSWGDCFRR